MNYSRNNNSNPSKLIRRNNPILARFCIVEKKFAPFPSNGHLSIGVCWVSLSESYAVGPGARVRAARRAAPLRRPRQLGALDLAPPRRLHAQLYPPRHHAPAHPFHHVPPAPVPPAALQGAAQLRRHLRHRWPALHALRHAPRGHGQDPGDRGLGVGAGTGRGHPPVEHLARQPGADQRQRPRDDGRRGGVHVHHLAPADELQEHHAEAEHVALGPQPARLRVARVQVPHSASRSRPRRARGGDPDREAEVGEAGAAVAAEQDVGRLDVPVYDAGRGAVQRAHGPRHVERDLHAARPRRRPRGPVQQVVQRAVGHELHDEKRRPPRRRNRADEGHDARVVARGREHGDLVGELGLPLRVRGLLDGDGDEPPAVAGAAPEPGPVDAAVAALADDVLGREAAGRRLDLLVGKLLHALGVLLPACLLTDFLGGAMVAVPCVSGV
uniref:Uncharacterized protein n=1 Tax=Triticum urartu TaxID=4572 RepID=A0A8R7TTX2_TRIUA